jgi:methylglutaconyl-CoA hydratase
MHQYKTIGITIEKAVSTIWLNRPEVRNAFNAAMVAEITRAIGDLSHDRSVRVIAIRGRGKVFCAGADLNWMREATKYQRKDNYREALELSRCFHKIYTCPKPVIALVHGASTGGANGLVAAADFAITTDDAIFSLSEVKIGLVPAVISPYIIKRIGEYPARELMLTARRITGKEAAKRGLVNISCPAEDLENEQANLTGQLLEGGPAALRITKELINDVCNNISLTEAVEKTAGIIADIRTTAEGQEGMASFLEKRKPRWALEN